jgi:hypothetical protein
MSRYYNRTTLIEAVSSFYLLLRAGYDPMEVELPFSEPVCMRIRWKVPQQLNASLICCFIRG